MTNNIKVLLAKIILPISLCVIVLSIDYFQNWVWGTFFVAFFGILIIISNANRLKKPFFISLLLSIFYAYLCFFISLAIPSPIIYILKVFFEINFNTEIGPISLTLNKCFFLISFALISPLFTYFYFNYLFVLKKDRFFYVLVILTVLILIAIGLFENAYNTSNYSIPIIWQSIMLCALQLILYKDEFKFYN